MKKLLFILFITLVHLPGMAQFIDDFSDGDLTNNPSWTGDNGEFEVLAGEMHLNAPAVSSVSYLSTPSVAMDDAQWQFDVRFEFNPSSSNYAIVHLSSDSSDLTNSSNGYYLSIGRFNDEVSLYKKYNNNATTLIDGTDNVLNTSTVSISVLVTRSANGDWELWVDADGGANSFVSQGAVNDIGIGTSEYFGVECKYTSTRSDKFYFDNFTVTGDPGTVFQGNTVYGDVVFNEVMADPNPPQALPNIEYLELFNATNQDILMNNFTLVNTTTDKVLTSFNLEAGAYLIVCDLDEVNSFTTYGDVLGVDGFSALSNGGDSLTLLNEAGVVLDVLDYSDSWHANSTKQDGGWSLERINPFTSCGSFSSWTSSENAIGGTPGFQNSVYDPAYTDPNFGISLAQVIDSINLQIQFTDFIEQSSSLQITVSSGQSVPVSSYVMVGNSLWVELQSELITGVIYEVQVTGITTCDGQPYQVSDLQVAIPDVGEAGDVIINEVLFNPRTGGVDFVELYNRSSKNIAIGDWVLANAEEGIIANQKIINPEGSNIILAGDFMVLTSDIQNIVNEYPLTVQSKVWEMSSTPSYNNEEGTVVLTSEFGEVIDLFEYNEDFHFELLNSEDGVSLERIFYDQPTNDPSNWHSASSTVGFATPGYENSQAKDPMDTQSELSLSTEVISPDNDGFDDQMVLTYELEEPGYVANISIYDGKGHRVQEVSNNELLATEGFIVWDGYSDVTGTKLPSGLYLVYAQLYNLEGTVNSYKLPFAITYK